MSDSKKKAAKKAISQYEDLIKLESVRSSDRKRQQDEDQRQRNFLADTDSAKSKQSGHVAGGIPSASGMTRKHVPTKMAPGWKDETQLKREWDATKKRLEENSRYKVNSSKFDIGEYLGMRGRGRYDVE